MENTEYIGSVALHYDFYEGKDLYADGGEEELLEIVKNYSEDEYNRIISERKSWPVLYHLSNIRENILSALPFSKEDEVLEVGAGCGAVTGAIAKNAGHVDCIELSKMRSLINAERHKGFDNIDIFVGNFQDIEKGIKKKYDYITLIGVLEYAGMYIESEEPFADFLRLISRHLKEGGKLAIAIENKYGLKYWAGCREDHLGTYFSGIEGYHTDVKVRTFSKGGLQKLCAQAGLKEPVFYYPYPDYKLPTAIYSDDYLPEKGMLNENLRNFDNDRMLLFDETKAFDNIIGDGLFDIFSNSYLIIAEK